MRTPDQLNRERAERVRRLWHQPGSRVLARERLRSHASTDPTVGAWSAILDGHHPLVAWLDGTDPYDALPPVLPDGLSPRQLFSSHPFPAASPWSILPTSPAS